MKLKRIADNQNVGGKKFTIECITGHENESKEQWTEKKIVGETKFWNKIYGFLGKIVCRKRFSEKGEYERAK